MLETDRFIDSYILRGSTEQVCDSVRVRKIIYPVNLRHKITIIPLLHIHRSMHILFSHMIKTEGGK